MLLWTLGCMYLSESGFLVFGDICPGVGLLDLTVTLFLTFWETSILFSTMAALIYMPTNSVWGFPFLHILANICYLCSFWWWPFWQVWGDISLWFWLAFPWMLVMVSIFSCARWVWTLTQTQDLEAWWPKALPKPHFLPFQNEHDYPHPKPSWTSWSESPEAAGKARARGCEPGAELGHLEKPPWPSKWTKVPGQTEVLQDHTEWNHSQLRSVGFSPADPWPFLCFSGRPGSCQVNMETEPSLRFAPTFTFTGHMARSRPPFEPDPR